MSERPALPPAWAMFGATLAVLRFGILFYWMNSYFAGSLIALAGALVLGALPRIRRHGRLRDAVVMGTGLAMRVWFSACPLPRQC